MLEYCTQEKNKLTAHSHADENHPSLPLNNSCAIPCHSYIQINNIIFVTYIVAVFMSFECKYYLLKGLCEKFRYLK